MKRLTVLLHCIMALAGAAGAHTPFKADRLVEITFAADDRGEYEDYHTIHTVWLSENAAGTDTSVWNWSERGSQSSAHNSREKAAAIRRLLDVIEPPKVLPADPNQIVTVRWLDGAKLKVLRFPVSEVPAGVYEALAIVVEAGDGCKYQEGFRFPLEPKKTAEQGVAPQSATRSELDSEGDDKPQPESDARSR